MIAMQNNDYKSPTLRFGLGCVFNHDVNESWLPVVSHWRQLVPTWHRWSRHFSSSHVALDIRLSTFRRGRPRMILSLSSWLRLPIFCVRRIMKNIGNGCDHVSFSKLSLDFWFCSEFPYAKLPKLSIKKALVFRFILLQFKYEIRT